MVTSATRSTPSVPGSAAGGGPQFRFATAAEGAGHRTGVAQNPGEATSIDAADTGDAVPSEQFAEVPFGAIVAGAARQVAHDDATAEHATRLVVGGVDAVVTDVGYVKVMI